jgi:prolyl-tRNA synthetase
MSKKPRTAITPTREENFPEWYQQVIKAADLAETSPTRGAMIIKPDGWAIWELMQKIFDEWLKDYGVQNCSFPLLIPKSFFEKEAEHVEGFAKECAVVTHHRLEDDGKGGLKPGGELEEPYVVRPTSETIIGDSMSRWIQSYRDLPMKLNQWGSVLRWEMRTRLFLRTSEFFWHEGHNAFEDAEGAKADCLHILDLYTKFFEEYLAFSGYRGIKTPEERFPGAVETYAFEAMMQDGKALQAATTHDLGQTFSRSFNIKYQNRDGGENFVHTTSWAFSTRAIGGMIMIHADDDGMVLPPRIAPKQAIILPVIKDDGKADDVMEYCRKLKADLKAAGIRAHVDEREMRTGDKMWDAIKKGVPVRIEVGGREMDEKQATLVRRDIGRDSKETVGADVLVTKVQTALDAMHDNMLAKSKAFRDDNTKTVSGLSDLEALFEAGHAGFARAPVSVLEDGGLKAVMDKHSLTARNMPFEDDGQMVLISKAY